MIKTILYPILWLSDFLSRVKNGLIDFNGRIEERYLGHPRAASWYGWKKIRNESQSSRPILLWITDTAIPFVAYDVVNRGRDLCWKVLHRHHPDHQYNIIRTELSPGYYDVDTLLIEACKSLIKRYVEDEEEGVAKLQEKIAWLEEEEKESTVLQVHNHRKAIEVYQWFFAGREEMSNRIKDLMAYRYGRKDFEILDFIGATEAEVADHPDLAKYREWNDRQDESALIHALEDAMEKKDTEFLKLMVEIRGGLWT